MTSGYSVSPPSAARSFRVAHTVMKGWILSNYQWITKILIRTRLQSVNEDCTMLNTMNVSVSVVHVNFSGDFSNAFFATLKKSNLSMHQRCPSLPALLHFICLERPSSCTSPLFLCMVSHGQFTQYYWLDIAREPMPAAIRNQSKCLASVPQLE